MALFQKKQDFFQKKKIKFIDHKNAALLHHFMDYFNQIKRREHTGTSLRNQKKLAVAIKRARHLGLAGFTR